MATTFLETTLTINEINRGKKKSINLESILLYKAISIMGKAVLPVIMVLGTFRNVVTIIILRRLRSSVSSVSVYFTAHAVFDLVLIHIAMFS